MGRFVAVPGARISPLGERWVAYSPLSGVTHVLNDESAAIIECVGTHHEGMEASGVADMLGADLGLDRAEMLPIVELSLAALVAAGLVALQPHRP